MTTELSVREHNQLTAQQIRGNVNLVQSVMQAVMIKDVHYGTIPGTPKPTLYKPGAEVLAATFRIAVSYKIEDLSGKGFSRYRITAIGTHQTSGYVMGEGMGACSSLEEKYKWRKASTTSEFEATPEELRRVKYGYDRTKRREYEIQQVRTEAADLDNTILKMACKRAQVAMTLNVTAASDIFTQDIEDLPEELRQTEDVDQATGEVKQAVKMPEAKAQPVVESATQDSGHAGQAIDGESVVMAEEGEIAYLNKKLAALTQITPEQIYADCGVSTLDNLTKENFVKIRDALKGKK